MQDVPGVPGDQVDEVIMGCVLMFVSLPAFVVAPILMLFLGLRLGWFPVSGWDGPEYFVLPVLVLGVRPAALLARFMRSSMLEVIRQDYIRTANAKGLSPSRVILKRTKVHSAIW